MPIAPQSVEETFAAPPDVVWRLVTDITRVGEWNPQCYRSEWLDGANGPAVGARFRGYNRRGPAKWSRDCRVDQWEPIRVFAFSTWTRDREETRWRYELQPAESGTRVIESFSNVGAPFYIKMLDAIAGNRANEDRRQNLVRSIARLKAVAERDASATR